MTLIYMLLAFVVALLLVGGVWRLASHRHALPCPVWLHWLVELDNPFTKTSHAAVIIQHLELRPGMVVLDMGCGPGRVTIPLARAVGEQGKVVAVDIQAGMLQRTRAKADAAGLRNIELLEASAGEAGLGHNRFDRALLVTVLGEIPEQAAALDEIFAALKPGGILSVTEIVFDPHFQRQSTVTRLAKESGFTARACFGNRLAYTLHLEKPSHIQIKQECRD
jgi:ubiquinone/menaquinone biosynthesis C-methylase UbiE